MIFTAIVMLILAFMGMILFDTKILFGILSVKTLTFNLLAPLDSIL